MAREDQHQVITLLLYSIPPLLALVGLCFEAVRRSNAKQVINHRVWASDRARSRYIICALLTIQLVISVWSSITSHAHLWHIIEPIYWSLTFAVSLRCLQRPQDLRYVTFLCIFPFIDSVIYTILPLFHIPLRHGSTVAYCSTLIQCLLLLCPLFTTRTWRPVNGSTATADQPSLEQICTPFSYYISYQWIEYLVRIALHRDLVTEDLPVLPDYDRANLWKSRVLQARRESLLWTVLILMKWELLLMSSLAIVISTTQFFAPLAMQQLLQYLENAQHAKTNPYLWAVLMLLGPLTWAISKEMYTFIATRLTIRMKAALTQLIYLKVMVMKANDGNEETSTGRISNLMSADIETITSAREIFLLIVQLPVCTIVSLVLLHRLMGYAALIGFAGLLCTLPIPGILANYMASFQRAASLATDTRLSVISENLRAIRVTKLFGWEIPKIGLITAMRDHEQSRLWRRNFVAIAIGIVTDILPSLNMFVTFFVYTYIMKRPLTASVAFTSISYFEILRSQFLWVGYLSRNVIQSQVSLQRIESFLNNAAELSPATTNSAGTTQLSKVHCAWPNVTGRRQFALQNVNVKFEPGLTIVIGPTASGKSSLLLALLGEMQVTSGKVELNRAQGIAYVSQSPWLQAATIRENILFGSALDAYRYADVIKACALSQDFKLLESGDETELGDNVATLSGGQKQRIALARALYSNAQTLLFDDVLSALDSGMGARIFQHAITGKLTRGKTIILVTHAVGLCTPRADQVVTLDNGTTSIRSKESVMNLHKRAMSDAEAITLASLAKKGNQPSDRQLLSTVRHPKSSTLYNLNEEKVAVGRVPRAAAIALLKNFGSAKFLCGLVVVQLAYQSLTIIKAVFPGIWADAYNGNNGAEINIGFYLGIYAILILGESLMNGICNAFVYHGNWAAAGCLHDKLLHAVLHAPLSWHDTTPVGRVLNRFSKDIQSLDTTITPWIRMSMDGLLKVAFSALSIATVLPLFVVPAGIVSVLGMLIGELYTKAQISIKRLVSVSESPLFSHFGDSINGIVTIRAFGAQNRFIRETETRIDCHTRPMEVLYTLTRWSQIRAEALGALVAFGAALLALNSKHQDAGLIGFSLSTASNFSAVLLSLVRALNEMEVELNSFQRVEEYAALPQEAVDVLEKEVRSEWPSKGDVVVQGLSSAYSSGTPDILKNISFNLHAGEKVGVIGRSGSGKSTLALSLLRLTHRVSGKIMIDGINIENVNLSALRHKVTIIPQDPLLFSGTVRTNLDPFDDIPEDVLRDALVQSGLNKNDQRRTQSETTTTEVTPQSTITLDSKVNEAGQNFSQGQRQIIALARAIVRNSKVIILDEATASCDEDTDNRIQHVLRDQFKTSTVLTIAHRLRTICDYDRIMVLSEGKLVEMDTPANLMKIKNGVFADMVNESEEAKELLDIIHAGKGV